MKGTLLDRLFSRRPARLATSSQAPRRLVSAELQPDAEGKLPSEFRLFVKGDNPNANGPPAVFDDRAAELTMAAYEVRRRAPDGYITPQPVMVDYEHLSIPGVALETMGDGRAADLKARGWADLELREDGSLWAVNVKWTKSGQELLVNGDVRFVSPAYNWEPMDDGRERVTSIHNIAVTAMPATYGAWELAAASVKGNQGMKLTKGEFMAAWGKMSQSDRRLLARLCVVPAPEKLTADAACRLLAITMQDLQKVVKAMGGEVGDLGAMIKTVMAWVDDLKATLGGQAPEGEPPATEMPEAETMADKPEEPAPAMASANLAAEIRALRTESAKQAAELALARQEREQRIEADRVELCRVAVLTNALRPGQVWEPQEKPSDPLVPQDYLRQMSLGGIRKLIEKGGGAPDVARLAVTPRPPADPKVTAAEGFEIDDYEIKRLRATVDRVRAEHKLAAATDYDYQVAEEKYREHRGQQYHWARTQSHAVEQRYGRKIESDLVLSSITGTIVPNAVHLLSTPVRPIEQFGPASQRAMEEFRLEYLQNMAALPPDWTTQIGDGLSSGALDLSFPVDFQTTKYRERTTAMGTPASTPQAADIKTSQRQFELAMQANLRRMMKGDFAHINTWQKQGAQMARARVLLRARLVVEQLESNPVWAVTKDKPNGLDGENFFSEDHLINPYDKGLGTTSNLSTAGRPLYPLSTAADSLTAEKATFLLVPDWDGVDFGYEATDMLIPTNLAEYARQLIDVKDVILRGELSGGGDGTMGPETNEHKDSGMARIIAPQLSKTGGNDANWYLISRTIIAQNRPPWVLCEDPEEEIREWGIDSDFYKNGPGDIKVQSCLGMCIALLFWQGIRKVLGA